MMSQETILFWIDTYPVGEAVIGTATVKGIRHLCDSAWHTAPTFA